MTDSEIVYLYLRRDEQAIRQTADRYGGRLRALSFGIIKDAQAAEECENDTYGKAWNAIPPNEPREYFYAFLARITRHLSLDLCRSRARLKRNACISQLSAELEQCIPAPDGGFCPDDIALRDILNRFLQDLGAEKRNVFLRRYWFMDSVADISRRYAISQSKVKTMLFRCRAQLREQLEKEGYSV